MMDNHSVTKKTKGQSLSHKSIPPAFLSSWTTLTLSNDQETHTVRKLDNPHTDHVLFHVDTCLSTMNLAWSLFETDHFPLWSSVLSDHQYQGRGQFNRLWISEPGNLYVTVRLPDLTKGQATAPLMTALAVNQALGRLGIDSEFKWPNDILVHRKKIGGILVEQRTGTVMAGIGVNLASAPSMSAMRDTSPLSPGFLGEWGFSLSPFDLWLTILDELLSLFAQLSDGMEWSVFITALEKAMAFKDEKIVFIPPQGPEFSAVLTGLSPEGGICLQTVDGEKTFLSGSILPVVH